MNHPNLISLERFVPHAFADLVAMRAFPEGAIPEPAYHKMWKDYDAVDDAEISRVTYAHDGVQITGIIARPKHISKPTDLVIYNRGGANNYGILTLYAAIRQFLPLVRAGYTVIGSNYRGNDGGTGRDEFGGRDIDDVMQLHDMIRTQPFVNDKPAYMVGHSRGGMMTYLMMKRGFPLRAAIAISAVSDLRGWIRLNELTKLKIDAKTESDALAERSAVCWPEKLTTPLLLLHGLKDDVVPARQSEQLAKLLASHGNPHKLVLYEHGNHALARDWPNVIQQTIDWFKQHED